MELSVYVSVHSPATNLQGHKTRSVEQYQKEELEELLDDHQEELNKRCGGHVLSSETTTGFSDALIKSVLKTCKYIFTVEPCVQKATRSRHFVHGQRCI